MLGTSSSTNFTVLKTLGIDIPSPSKTSTEKHLKPSTFPIVSSKSRLVNFQSTTFHLNRFRFVGEKGRPPPFSSEKKTLKTPHVWYIYPWSAFRTSLTSIPRPKRKSLARQFRRDGHRRPETYHGHRHGGDSGTGCCGNQTTCMYTNIYIYI